MKRIYHLLVLITAIAVAAPGLSFGQGHPEFIALGRISAALYRPDKGPAPHVAFVIGHRTANYLKGTIQPWLSRALFQHQISKQ